MKKKLFLKFENSINDINFKAHAGEDSIELIAADAGDGSDDKKKFRIRAYNGGPMHVGFSLPVVIDLAGMDVSKKSRPILLNHDTDRPVGHSTNVDIQANRVVIEGQFSFDNEDTQNIIESAKSTEPRTSLPRSSVSSRSSLPDTVWIPGRRGR